MDHTAAPRIDFYSPCDHQPSSSTHLHALPSPDTESSRGRPRRRDPLNPFALARHSHHHHHAASRESSTLRGRCRHRSLSRLNIPSGRPSHHHHQRAASPLPLAEKRRRGQSPSRSQSPCGSKSANGTAAAEGLLVVSPPVIINRQRRRQRTQSRSRRHGLEGAFASVAVAGRRRLEGWVAEDGDVNGKD